MSHEREEAVGGFINFLYIIIMMVCVIVSTFLSYLGLKSSFGYMTIPTTIVIFVLLLAADVAINHAVRMRKSLGGPLFILLVGLIISTLSNFTFLYTNFMTRDVARDTYLVAWSEFQENMENAKSVLRRDPQYIDGLRIAEQESELEARIDQELANLRRQVLDRNNPGVGIEAQIHVDNIERLLATTLTDLAVPDSRNRSALEVWLTEFEQLVSEVRSKTPRANLPFANIIQDADELLAAFKTEVNELRQAGFSTPAEQVGAIERMQTEAREVESIVNAALSPGERRVEFSTVEPGDARLGEIVYTLHNGFIQRPNMTATGISLLFSFFIDLLPLLFALALLRNVKPRGAKRANEHVLN